MPLAAMAPEALRCDVGQDFAFGKVAGEGKGGGDSGVEVRARDVARWRKPLS